MKLGNIEIDNPIYLAPMAGFTDHAFRIICKGIGANVLTSEMISAKGLFYNDKKTFELMFFEEAERPFGIQLFGSEPDIMAEAVEKVLMRKPDFIDINMGCPTPKIVSNGDGCALMKDPVLAGKVIKSVVKASSVPVSVKIRSGWDKENINALEIASIAEKNGASLITVHGRTRDQFYRGAVNFDIIKKVKETVSIPVIGNGDIFSAKDAENMLKQTGCDGVMIGRGALGNPFIFEEIAAFFQGKEYIRPDIKTKMEICLKHIRLSVNDIGEEKAIRDARKRISFYLKGIKNSHTAKCKAFEAKTLSEIEDILFSIM